MFPDDVGRVFNRPMSKAPILQTYLAWSVVLAVGVLLATPAIFQGLPTTSYDGWIHSQWASAFGKQFWGGELYPRWLTDLNGGLGSPAFFYYPPLPFWTTSLLQKALTHDAHSWHALGVSAGCALILSGVFALLWLRRLTDFWPAAVGAVAYMLIPYHGLIQVYWRGSFGELWGMTWLPLVMLSAHATSVDFGRPTIRLAAAYCFLILSHLPTTLIFSFVPPVYAYVVASPSRRWFAIKGTCLSMLWGIGLAAIFLVPALTLQEEVHLEEMISGYPIGPNFLGLSALTRADQHISTPLAWTSFSMLVGGGFAWLAAVRCTVDSARRQALFWGLVAILSAMLMSSLSKPVWEAIGTLRKIQFPWRFGTVLSLATAALLALGFGALGTKPPWPVRVFLACAWSVAATWIFYSINCIAPYLERIPYAPDPLLKEVPEYRPRLADKTLSSAIDRFLSGDGINRPLTFTGGNGMGKVKTWEPRRIVVAFWVGEHATILLRQYAFKGWRGRLDEKNVSFSVHVSDGLIQLQVPPGEHQVEIQLTRTAQERIGIFISGSSAFLIFGVLTYRISIKRFGGTPRVVKSDRS